MEEYSRPDSAVYIPSVMICSSTKLGYGGKVEELELKKDSLLTFFMNALERIELSFEITDNLELSCAARQTRDKSYFNPLTENEVLNHIKNVGSKRWQLLPVIGVFIDDVGAYDAVRMPNVSLQVYLIADGKVIYSSFKLLIGESINTLPANPPLSKITQEEWDELVRLVFEDYLNALDTQNQN